jgi:hypothetical protein
VSVALEAYGDEDAICRSRRPPVRCIFSRRANGALVLGIDESARFAAATRRPPVERVGH